MVVIYHTLGHSEWFRQGMYDYQASGTLAWLVTLSPLRVLIEGRVAVMSFFVLSGYVLTRGFWRQKPPHWFHYYVRRGLRLYPPVIASAILAVVVLGVQQAVTGTGRGLVDLDAAGTSVGQIVNNLGLVTLVEAPLNVVWWSLRWEIWFSILLPVILFGLVSLGCGPNRRFRAAPALFGVACVVLVGLQPWIRLTFETSHSVTRAILYLPMFGVGIALAAYEQRLVSDAWPRGNRGWLLLGAAALLIMARGAFGQLAAHEVLDPSLAHGIGEAAPLVGVGVLIALLVGWSPARRVMGSRPVVWVGERSYSLYLVHLPLVGLLGVVFSVQGASLWFIAVCLAVSLSAMVVFYRYVERPSAELSNRLGRPRPAPAPDADRRHADAPPGEVGEPVAAR